MPDVWTYNPPKLRSILRKHEGDIRCGVEPRVLKDRDPEWTCTMEWDEGQVHWIGDLYIHDARKLITDPYGPHAVLLLALVAVMFSGGYLLGKWAGRRGR